MRINPGNIGQKEKIKQVIAAAKDYDCALRIGVNAGSLEKDILEKYKGPCPEALVDSAMRNIQLIEDEDFYNFKVSVKSSDVFLSVASYRLLSSKTDYPLHLGVTESGSFVPGSVKTSIGLGSLLMEGIGDTIRVSLSDDPIKEIKIGTGRKIKNGIDIAILSLGHVGNYAIEACQELNNDGIDAAHYDMRFAKPLDTILLHEVFSKFDKIITIEDGCVIGGMGSAIIEFMVDHGYSAQIKRLGIPDEYIEHGTQGELHAECNYDKAAILSSVKRMVHIKERSSSQSA